ncbi:ArsR family transcriptional regulator [Rhodococcus sp. WS4]|nr:ArsR family transcriptional regulator [Rhodococcus sp. WS4]
MAGSGPRRALVLVCSTGNSRAGPCDRGSRDGSPHSCGPRHHNVPAHGERRVSSESHLPDEIAHIARILADPVRLHLLTIIARAREISCTHLLDHADVGASTVSYHVKMLTEGGLVTVVTDGRRRYVCFEREALRLFTELLASSVAQRALQAPPRSRASDDEEPPTSSAAQGRQ